MEWGNKFPKLFWLNTLNELNDTVKQGGIWVIFQLSVNYFYQFFVGQSGYIGNLFHGHS
jgi:hypothetical protein